MTTHNQRLLGIDKLVTELLDNENVNSYYENLIYQTQIEAGKESRKIALFAMLELYVRVRVFSYAREKVEQLKRKKLQENKNKKTVSKKGLRKTLKNYQEENSNKLSE